MSLLGNTERLNDVRKGQIEKAERGCGRWETLFLFILILCCHKQVTERTREQQSGGRTCAWLLMFRGC